MPLLRRSRSQPPTDLATLTSTSSAPEQYRILRAELGCYLCAVTCGALEAPPTATMPLIARFCLADGSPGRMLAWRGLRCPRCRSRSLVVDEFETVVRRVERVDWATERPRRGRPPRWLVALRERQDAA